MGISEQIGGIYGGIEDKFYSAMDFLSDRGIPVYAVIDPLEDRGIPAFPVIFTSLLVLVFLAYGFLFLSTSETSVVLSITDDKGSSLSGVELTLRDEQGHIIELGSTTFQNGQSVKVPRGTGTRLDLEAKKVGYEPSSQRVFLNAAETNVDVELNRIVVQLAGAIRLVDSETSALVQDAKVKAKISETGTISCSETSKGIYSCPGVIEGDATELTIEHANYEQKVFSTNFFSTETNEIELVPKASASTGKSNFIVRVFDFDSKQRLGNYNLKIYDAVDNELITQITETDNDGQHIEKISKGTQVRVVVEHESYLTYDSSVAQENITLRGEEELLDVYLKPGTNALTVGVLDATGRPITNMDVLLHNVLGELLEKKTTSLAGEVIFENLSADEVYYVSSWGENFIPKREEVFLTESNRAGLRMERSTANNSGSLVIYTVDEKSNALNDVTLNFFEDTNESGLAPLGIPAQKTDVTGKFSFLAPLNVNLVVKASKGNLVGEDAKTILETFNNEMLITMAPPFSSVTLTVLGVNGSEVASGFVSIVGNENVLFEGDYEKGGVEFNPGENKYVNVIFTDDEGNILEEQVYVENLEKVSVSPKAKTSGSTNPELEYLGVFNIDGTPANGLAKGIDYYLKFRVGFAEGTTNNGLHVRLGDDSIRFADSQDAGITGFAASGATGFYGRSYSSLPEPGLEGIDFSNAGQEGSFNKFLELYFNSGGEKIVKVRVKAKDTAITANIDVHYRAWSKVANLFYRTPQDAGLSLEEFSAEKTSLYAQTESKPIKILEANASCSNKLCASYKFVRNDGSEFKPNDFKAVLGQVYALEISLAPELGAQVTLKASTAKTTPKIGFQGFTINDTTNFPDSNSTDTSLDIANVSAPEGEATNVRLYFKPRFVENSSITLQLISGETVINEQFYFEIFEEKALTLTTIPKNVVLGENFVIVIEDEDGAEIEDAEILLSSGNGEHLETLSGNGSANSGGNGRYSIENTFDAGVLRYEVSAPRHRPLSGTIEVTKEGVIEWQDAENFIVIPNGSVNSEKFANLINNSKQNIQEVSFEIEQIGSFPEGMSVDVTPLSNLPADSSQRVIISAEYNGDSERAHGEARIIAKGRTETGFTVTSETKVAIDFNPRVPAECVEFSKKRIAIYVASGLEDRDYYDAQYGTLPPNEPTKLYKYNNFTTSSSDTFTARLAQKPECQSFELELKPETLAKNSKNQGIEIDTETIALSPQIDTTEGARRTDNDDVIVTATNNLIRNYPGKQKFSFDVVFVGNGFQKSLPVDVYVWNPRYALQVSRNIELFLGPNDRGQLAAQVPLFIRNIGEADIENVEIVPSSRTSNTNVDITIAPPFPIQFLQKGQAIDPPKTIVAQALRNERTTLVDVKELDITGVIDGTTFNFGPVIVTSHISADQCLQVVPGNVDFFSTKSSEGSLSKEIRVKNTCAEEVRIIDISGAQIGNNRLRITPTNSFVGPGQEARLTLILDKKEDYQGAPIPVYLKAFLPRSGTPIDSSPLIVDIKLGKNALADDKVVETKVLPICGTTESREIQFPIVATEQNTICDNAYCDAEQLSNYLTERLDQYIKGAERQVQSYQGQVQSKMCSDAELARGFCTFEDLGVKTDSFVVYMQHDTIGPDLMNRALKQKSGSIANYSTSFISGDTGGEFLGGFSRQIFFNDNFRGCGRYNVTLRGNVRVQGGRTLLPELMNVVVDITQEQEEGGSIVSEFTEQCQPKIQNVANFLPKDNKVTLSQRLGAWPGAVESVDDKLFPISQEVAEKLFGSKERASKSVSGTNKIELSYGETDKYIVRVEMDKTAGTAPVTIRAVIKEGLGGDEKFQSDIAKEAASAIADLRNNVVAGCIGDDESYVLLKSLDSKGKPDFEVRGKIPVRYNEDACTEVRVMSDIKETVSLEGRKGSEFDGITLESPFFLTCTKNTEGNCITTENESRIRELPLNDLNELIHKYEAKALVCVEGTGQLQFANGKEIVVSVKRLVGENKNPVTHNAALEVCGIHPITFIEQATDAQKIKANSDKDYYATFIWKGDPQNLRVEQMVKAHLIEQEAQKANDVVEGRKYVQAGETDKDKKARRNAAMGYGLACTGTSIATSLFRPTLGPVGAIFNVVFDCGPVFMYLMFGDNPYFQAGLNYIQNVFEKISEVFRNIGGGFLGKLVDGVVGSSDNPKVQETVSGMQNGTITSDSLRENAINVFLGSTTVGSISDQFLSGQTFSSTQLRGIGQAEIIADNIAKNIAEQVTENALGGESGTLSESIRSKIRAEAVAELKAVAKANTQTGIGGGRFGLTTVVTDEQIKTATQKAVDKVGKQEELLTQIYEQKEHLKGNVKASTIVDESANKFVNELGVNANAFGSKTFEVEPGTDLTDNQKIMEMETRIRERFKTKLRNELGGNLDQGIIDLIDGTRLTPDTELVKLNDIVPVDGGNLQREVKDGIKVKLTSENIDSMIKEINGKIGERLIDTLNGNVQLGENLADYQTALRKKFGTEAFGKFGIQTEEALRDIRPKFWSLRGFGRSLATLARDGLAGGLANVAGLLVYDAVYDLGTKGIIGNTLNAITVEEEQALADLSISGIRIEFEDNTKPINKYSTYPISITSKAGERVILIKNSSNNNEIPQGTEKEFILDSCNTEDFSEEIGTAFPGIIPTKDKTPNIFLNRSLGKEHAQMVENYLKKRDDGSRLAVIVSGAAGKDQQKREAFEQATKLNMEALVASIGVAKTGLGLEGNELIMFGCGIKSNNSSKYVGIESNAACTVDKIFEYQNVCASDPTCYFNKFTEDSENQINNYKTLKITNENFIDIYTSWNQNPVKAAYS